MPEHILAGLCVQLDKGVWRWHCMLRRLTDSKAGELMRIEREADGQMEALNYGHNEVSNYKSGRQQCVGANKCQQD